MKIIVARHCETAYNAGKRLQGLIDIPLNARGIAQAERLASDVRRYDIALICCSELQRAKQTAAIVAKVVRVPVWTTARLNECDFGKLDGVTLVEFGLRCGWKNLPIAAKALDADFTTFGGDRGRDLFDRQKLLLDEYKAFLADKTIMVIGHARSLRTLLAPLGHPTDWLRHQGSHIVIEY